MSLPPKWAMGMKYDPAEKGYNTSFVEAVVGQFASRGIRPDRVVLEPAWQGEQYNWDTAKFPDVPALVAGIAPTRSCLGCRHLSCRPHTGILSVWVHHIRGGLTTLEF